MSVKIKILAIINIMLVVLANQVFSGNRATPMIIDHTCTDLKQVPEQWIDSAQVKLRMYYAHTSHGEQLTVGFGRIENIDKKYDVTIGNQVLPAEAGSLCIYDNPDGDPDDYWKANEWENGLDKTRLKLKNNPTINVSFFVWCIDLYYEGEAYVKAYLDSISKLEKEFPNATFIYATCHAQYAWDPQYNINGYNRFLRNEQIRKFCKENNKVLFDFEDLDSWWFNPGTQQWENYTNVVQGHVIPMQHPHFEGDQAGHTTYESCEQKAKAGWVMLAKLAGWEKPVSVKLTYFNTAIIDNTVRISWQTASESNNYGFEIERGTKNTEFKKIGFVKGSGTCAAKKTYEFRDDEIEVCNHYFYRLKQLDLDGTFEYSNIIELNFTGPKHFFLQQNYPNPFNAETIIQYILPQNAKITISIYDILGKKVKTLLKTNQAAGSYSIKWDGHDDTGQKAAGGIYFLQVQVNSQVIAMKKMILIS